MKFTHSVKSKIKLDEKREIDDIHAGDELEFLGYLDDDNHFGVFVFRGPSGKYIEIRGDFSTSSHHQFKKLKIALGL